jgi:hypothetical protein
MRKAAFHKAALPLLYHKKHWPFQTLSAVTGNYFNSINLL